MDFFACYTTIITYQWRLYTCYTCFLFFWAVVVAFNSWRLTPAFNFVMAFSSFCPYNFMKHKMIVEFGFTLICLLLGSLLSRKFNFFFYLYHKISNEEYMWVQQNLFRWQMPQMMLRMESCGFSQWRSIS